MKNTRDFEPLGRLREGEARPEEEAFAAPEEERPVDCARILAWHMLRAATGTRRAFQPLGLYIVHTPTDEWCSALKSVITDIYLDNRPNCPRRRLVGSGLPLIHVFEHLAKSDAKQAEHLVGTIQESLAVGQTVIVVATNLATLPEAMRRASDRIVVVPKPTQRDVIAVFRTIGTKPGRLDLNELACEKLTPAVMGLAYRKNISASSFLDRLRELTRIEAKPTTTKAVPLDRLHGVGKVWQWASDVKADVELYRQGKLAWHELSRGLLLAGPPGTGKTTLAASIADFCGMEFVPTSYAVWQSAGSGHLGDVHKAMAADFKKARERAPSIMLIDELDTLRSRTERGGQRNDWWHSNNNAVLEQMDGSAANEGVIFIGATNFPDLVDSAILRSGRMEEKIYLELPNVEALAKIYRDQLAGTLEDWTALQNLGRMSAGLTGADVVKICTTARRRARNAKRTLSFDDLLSALAGDGQSDPSHRHRIATHEAGHAVAALASPLMRIDHVTIVGSNDTGGRTLMGPRTSSTMTPDVLDAYLVALLAGRAAEEVLLGEISSGAGGREGCDLSHATMLAAKAELSLGICNQRLIWYVPPSSAEELGRLFARRPDIARCVQERLDRAYAQARELIRLNAFAVQKLADELLQHRVVTGAEAAALLKLDGSSASSPRPGNGPDPEWHH